MGLRAVFFISVLLAGAARAGDLGDNLADIERNTTPAITIASMRDAGTSASAAGKTVSVEVRQSGPGTLTSTAASLPGGTAPKSQGRMYGAIQLQMQSAMKVGRCPCPLDVRTPIAT